MSWLVAGGLVCALAVAAGAFGAHGLASRLDARGLELWETASRYLMYGGLALLVAGAVDRFGARALHPAVGACLLAGALIFSGTVFVLALGGPRWLGAVTPIGGVLLIVGFVLFAIQGLRS